MIWSWRTRSNSQSGLGAELLLPAKSAFFFCCLFYFSLQTFTWFFFVLRNVSCPFSLPFFSVFIPLSTPSKILPKAIMTLNFARNRQVSGEGEGVVSIIFSCREILLGRVPNSSKLSMWTLQILPRPSTASTGTTSRRYFERMESPLTLLRSSKASMKTLPAVSMMVTSPHWCQAGCLMSTLLFSLVVDWIMQRTTEDQFRGISNEKTEIIALNIINTRPI